MNSNFPWISSGNFNAYSKGGDGVAIGVNGGHISKKFIQCTIFTQNTQGNFLNKTKKIHGI
jgi:hypothetical protein